MLGVCDRRHSTQANYYNYGMILHPAGNLRFATQEQS